MLRKFIDLQTKKPVFVSEHIVVTSIEGVAGTVLYTQGQRFILEGDPEAVAAELAKPDEEVVRFVAEMMGEMARRAEDEPSDEPSPPADPASPPPPPADAGGTTTP
jgi:hypothetical protein